MLSRFDPRQRRAIIAFGSLWLFAMGFAALGLLLGG